MKTYQDLLALGENEAERARFILDAIHEHKASEEYNIAADAELYYKGLNPTILNFQKFVYNQFGQKVPDIWAANNKIASKWYPFFITQAVQYLLGNGVTFTNDETKEKLGKNFDKRVEEALTAALNGSVSFGFYNNGTVNVFALTEFMPLYDEENGALRAGIRFWQIADNKPLRVTLYEEDGYTEYTKKDSESDLTALAEKRPYIEIAKESQIDGVQVYGGENYSTFPIVPLWNINKLSCLAGNRGTLDAYDLMISGLINNVSDGEFIYWILQNCGGMSTEDDAKFVEQLKLTHVAHADNDDGTGAKVDAHQATVPFEATAEALDRLKEQLFHDFMALDVNSISANATNDQIQAAYEPLNQKTDDIEYLVTEFIMGILAVAGIEDEPTYTRSQMSNRKETLDMVLSAAEYLDDEYVTRKIMTLLGDADKADEVIARKIAEESARFDRGTDGAENEEEAADAENDGADSE